MIFLGLGLDGEKLVVTTSVSRSREVERESIGRTCWAAQVIFQFGQQGTAMGIYAASRSSPFLEFRTQVACNNTEVPEGE